MTDVLSFLRFCWNQEIEVPIWFTLDTFDSCINEHLELSTISKCQCPIKRAFPNTLPQQVHHWRKSQTWSMDSLIAGLWLSSLMKQISGCKQWKWSACYYLGVKYLRFLQAGENENFPDSCNLPYSRCSASLSPCSTNALAKILTPPAHPLQSTCFLTKGHHSHQRNFPSSKNYWSKHHKKNNADATTRHVK